MKTQSAKAKGRRLQKLVVQKILEKFSTLGDRDVQSRAMGSQGTDVVLSEAAFKLFPFNIECKNKETNKSLLNDFEQAKANSKSGIPLLILSANASEVLVIMRLDDFL